MTTYIPRNIFQQLVESIKIPEISAILGPRQVGKTTLMEKLEQYIIKKDKVSPLSVFKYNFDNPELRAKLRQAPLYIIQEIERAKAIPLNKLSEKIFLFIDEAQKAPSQFDILKMLYDQNKDRIKIFISGSSSLNIQKKSAESLAGRIRFFYLHPLIISEIINHYICPLGQNSLILDLVKNRLDWTRILELQSMIYQNRHNLRPLWENVLVFGALPKLMSVPEAEEKLYILRDFFETYIQKEIKNLKEVGDIDLFAQVLTIFIKEDMQLLNFNKISENFGISRDTLRKYFSIFKNTFIVNSLPPYIKAPRKQLRKGQKIIFFEQGIVNYIKKIEDIEQLKNSNHLGFSFKNIIINNFLNQVKNLPQMPELYFWRDYQNHEIDLICQAHNLLAPIEISYANQLSQEKKNNFRSFFQKYSQADYGLLVYQGENAQQIKIANKKIFLIPYWLWW